ncbi:MAG: hypothetical protein JOY69_01670 [Candidatus Eremiobacteraeota bacterium]|nr:hypothetical protein [Candidatus Eremiobacteraeota bacterium]
MKFDVRVAFAAIALLMGACQGGLDSGAGGMPGMMGPPVSQPGPMGTGGMQGPTIGANGQAELTAPGSTLAPNESQFAVGDAPNGVKCPTFAQFTCSLSFNIPTPAPSSSPGSKSTPKPTPSPTPSPSPSASSSDENGDDSGDSGASPSPTPPGTITLQMEPLPKDVPTMTNPDPRALRITPMVAVRLQSDTDFSLNGGASVEFTMPRQQVATRSFAVQLYNETAIRGKRSDQYVATYTKSTVGDTTVQFAFTTPRVTVKRGQIWLLALYGFQYPPGTTPTPSPDDSSSSASPSPSPSPT